MRRREWLLAAMLGAAFLVALLWRIGIRVGL